MVVNFILQLCRVTLRLFVLPLENRTSSEMNSSNNHDYKWNNVSETPSTKKVPWEEANTDSYENQKKKERRKKWMEVNVETDSKKRCLEGSNE